MYRLFGFDFREFLVTHPLVNDRKVLCRKIVPVATDDDGGEVKVLLLRHVLQRLAEMYSAGGTGESPLDFSKIFRLVQTLTAFVSPYIVKTQIYFKL